jgi:hypothetical protein
VTISDVISHHSREDVGTIPTVVRLSSSSHCGGAGGVGLLRLFRDKSSKPKLLELGELMVLEASLMEDSWE